MATDFNFHHPHFALFRATFSAPERAAELVCSALSEEVIAAVAWQQLRLVEGSFVDDELRKHHADLLFQTEIAGRPGYVYLLLEHKSDDDRFAAFQLLRYVVRIWERHRTLEPDDRLLPPVLPFVLHHGTTTWEAPRSISELIGLDRLPVGLAALQPEFTFVLEDLATGNAQDLDSWIRKVLSATTLDDVLV